MRKSANIDSVIGNSRRTSAFHKIGAVVCVFVFLFTFYTLISPADSKSKDCICELSEHVHTDDCYALCLNDEEPVLSCGFDLDEGIISHIHDENCYIGDKFVCPLDEYVHSHGEDCYDENGSVICGAFVHQHSEDCIRANNADEPVMQLICNTPSHTHGSDCYAEIDLPKPVSVEDNSAAEQERAVMTPQPAAVSSNASGDPDNTALPVKSAANTLDLTNPAYSGYIKSITLNQIVGDDVTLIQNNQTGLDASGSYRLDITLNDILVSDFRNASSGYVMCIYPLPEWFTAHDSTIFIDRQRAAELTIARVGSANGPIGVFIDFKDDVVQGWDKIENAFFGVRGEIDWEKLENNQGTINLPPLQTTLTFEGNLPELYGNIRMIKGDPEIIEVTEGGTLQHYLRYTISAASLSGQDIPNVKVTDKFKDSQFIGEYCGINTTLRTLSGVGSGYMPYETIVNGSSTHGTVKLNGTSAADGFTWNIGTLKANETRHLTYYVKLDRYYAGAISRGDIENTASAFAGNVPKDESSSVFVPKAGVNMRKSKIGIDPVDVSNGGDAKTGTGMLHYSITVSAYADNSYTLENLKLTDEFGAQFKPFIDSATITLSYSNGRTVTIPYSNGRFEQTIPTLAPGESVTIEYSVHVTGLYAAAGDDFQLKNTAQVWTENNANRGGASNKKLNQYECKTDFSIRSWTRKSPGETVTEDRTISSAWYDAVYNNDKSSHSSPISFNVRDGYKKYTVIVNEGGAWGLRAANMQDSFVNAHMQYVGYVRVDCYNPSYANDLPDGSANEDDTAAVLLALEGKTPTMTKWYDVDGHNSFSFKPEQIGISDNTPYIYKLTYYAKAVNVDNLGQVVIANQFWVDGTIGVNGRYYNIPDTLVSVTQVVTGGLDFHTEKRFWYSDGTDLYWIVKIDGSKIPQNLAIKDNTSSTGNANWKEHNVDSLVNIYKGSSDADFSSVIKNVEDLEEASGFTKLSGENVNDTGTNFSALISPDERIDGYRRLSFSTIDELVGKEFLIAHQGSDDKTYFMTNSVSSNTFAATQSPANAAVWTLNDMHFVKDSPLYYFTTTVNGATKYLRFDNNGIGFEDTMTVGDNNRGFRLIQNASYPNMLQIRRTGPYRLTFNGTGFRSENKDDATTYHKFFVKDSGYHYDGVDYKWGKESNTSLGFVFQTDIPLAQGETAYAVIKTTTTRPTAKDKYAVYKNEISTLQLDQTTVTEWAGGGEDEFLYKTANGIMKESGGVFTIDNEHKFVNGEGNTGVGTYAKELIEKHRNEMKPGYYINWYVHVNYDGRQEGLVEVTDQLPEYLELSHIEPYWVHYMRDGSTDTNDEAQAKWYIDSDNDKALSFPVIQELENASGWKKTYVTPNVIHYLGAKSQESNPFNYYYNKTTNTIRWNVDNVIKDTDLNRFHGRDVEFIVVCRLRSDYLLRGQQDENIVRNSVSAVNKGIPCNDTAECAYDLHALINKTYVDNGTDKKDIIQSSSAVISYKITINPDGLDIIPDSNYLPVLVDEMSGHLAVDPSTITVKAGETAVTGFVYSIENSMNGSTPVQRIAFEKLPDGKTLTITYDAAMTVIPKNGEHSQISNKAYWEGYTPPSTGNLSSYVSVSGYGGFEVSAVRTFNLTKVDAVNRAKKLSGAEFELYTVNASGVHTKINTELVTAADGKITLSTEGGTIAPDTIYCIKETKAPDNYILDSTPYYFTFVSKNYVNTYTDQTVTVTENGVAKTYAVNAIFGQTFNLEMPNTLRKIGVEKQFTDANGDVMTPVSCTVRFGLYDLDPIASPRAVRKQILAISYNESGAASYALDGKAVSTPEFTAAQPNSTYYVYELDENGDPIANGMAVVVNEQVYIVDYGTDGVPAAVIGDTVEVTNNVAVYELPALGGIGLNSYYLSCLPIVIALIGLALICKKIADRRNIE